MFWKGGGKTKRGEQNGYRNDTSGHPSAGAGGRDSNLASQQGMGLRSERRSWLDTGDRVDFIRAGQDIARISIALSLALTTGAIEHEQRPSEGRGEGRCRQSPGTSGQAGWKQGTTDQGAVKTDFREGAKGRRRRQAIC